MKIFNLIEKYFWIFLLGALIMGLSFPVFNGFFMSLLVPELMIMLFTVFLKTDLTSIWKKIKNYKLMLYLSFMYLIFIPLIFYVVINFFDKNLAMAALLLLSMPAGSASPALADIIKGNKALSMSIAIITSVLAPFTISLIFGFLKFENLSINISEMFFTIALVVFVPMVLSQIIKKHATDFIKKVKHSFTSINVIVLFFMVFATFGSQREIILNDPLNLLWKVVFLYLIFILLHVLGYLMGYNRKKEDKISMAIGGAYMNNGLAIVLAASYFSPSILILMVLAEIPWNTLLAPFNKVLKYLK
jgi:predicted Na+-dependent transporter